MTRALLLIMLVIWRAGTKDPHLSMSWANLRMGCHVWFNAFKSHPPTVLHEVLFCLHLFCLSPSGVQFGAILEMLLRHLLYDVKVEPCHYKGVITLVSIQSVFLKVKFYRSLFNTEGYTWCIFVISDTCCWQTCRVLYGIYQILAGPNVLGHLSLPLGSMDLVCLFTIHPSLIPMRHWR